MSSLINVLLGTPVLRTLALERTNRRRVATDWVAVAHGALIAELPGS